MAAMNDLIPVSPPSLPVADVGCIREVFHPADASITHGPRFVSARVAVTVFVAGGIVIFGVSHVYGFSVRDGLVIYCFLGLPLLIACVSSRVIQARQSYERTTKLVDGVLTVSTNAEAESSDFRQCSWFYGKVKDDPSLSYQNIRQKAILLVFPSGRTIACGLTPLLYPKWRDAIHSFGCRKVLRREGALGALLGILAIVGFFGGGWLGEHLGVALRDNVFQLAPNNPFASLLPSGLLILGLWFGGISPWFIPGCRRYTDRERQQFNKFAVGLPAKLAILGGAFLGGNVLASLILVLFFIALLLVLTRVVLR
jgi:hypothetical protein